MNQINTIDKTKKTFMLMAGGTGGHIFPALAVAQQLQAQGHEVIWLGSKGSMEERIVPQHGIELFTVAMKGIRGNGLKRKLLLPWMLFQAVKAVRAMILGRGVDAVVGFGGFVTFPGGLAARLCGVPMIIHEQNAVAGLSNRVLSRWANRVLYAFPQVFPEHQNGLVGNPVRADIAQLEAPEQRFAQREGHLKILVVGGSLGAQILNETVPAALAKLPENQRPSVYHQSGKGKLELLKNAYAQLNVAAECCEFIDDMSAAYREADLVICRSGALTIAELTAAGVGAILVPYPHAVDDHQTANAGFMVSSQAAVLLPQSELTAEKLAIILSRLSREDCLKYAQNARELAMPDSAKKVAEVVLASLPKSK